MNKNPWQYNDLAFYVMFTDIAEFQPLASTIKTSLQCCIFPREDVDPFTESDNESNIKSMSVLVRKCDWTFHEKPSVGDTVKLPTNEKYKVATVDQEQNWYRLTCRSI